MADITLQDGTTSFLVNGLAPTDFDINNTTADQNITVTAVLPEDSNCTKQVQVTVRVCPTTGYEYTYQIGNQDPETRQV